MMEELSRERVLRTARDLCPSAFSLIGDVNEPIATYSKRLYSNSTPVVSNIAKESRRLLSAALGRQAFRLNRSASDLESEFFNNPVIQTGPHHRLAFDNDFISTLAFSLLGSREADRPTNVMFSCSTITLEEQNHRGPGWLRTSGEPIRVFDMPRRTLSKRSMSTTDEPVFMSSEIRRLSSEWLPPWLEINFPAHALSPRELVSYINEQLFGHLQQGTGVGTLTLREPFFADLIADMLEAPTFLRQLFEDDRMVAMISRLRTLTPEPAETFVPRGTDLLWASTGGRVRALRLVNNHLVSERNDLSFPFEPALLARKPRDGELLPSLFFVFLIACILPLSRALGGSYQSSYLEVFTRSVIDILDMNDVDESVFSVEAQTRSLVGWGHNVIAHNVLQETVSHGPGAVGFSARLGESGLSQASESFAAFVEDGRWQALALSQFAVSNESKSGFAAALRGA